jgi:hypothetical protein
LIEIAAGVVGAGICLNTLSQIDGAIKIGRLFPPDEQAMLACFKIGDGGGRIVTEGTPEQVASVKESYTGQYLKKMLQ